MVKSIPKTFVLSIGINDYDSKAIRPLRWAVDDARSFHQACLVGRDPEYVQSRLILGRDAGIQTIRHAFGEWLNQAMPEDNVIAYFAGHGAREILPGRDINSETEAYILPVDVSVKNLYSTAISLPSELPTVLKRLRARNAVFIFDCCLSGAARMSRDGQRNRGIDGPNFVKATAISDVGLNVMVRSIKGEEIDIGNGVSVMMACGPNQAALESDELRHGIFTYYLLELLLNKRDSDRRSLSVGQMYADVAKAVSDRTEHYQIPMLEGRLLDQRIFSGD